MTQREYLYQERALADARKCGCDECRSVLDFFAMSGDERRDLYVGAEPDRFSLLEVD